MAPELGREAYAFFLAVGDRRKEVGRVRRADLGHVLRTSFCFRISSIITERSLVLGLGTSISDPVALTEASRSSIWDTGWESEGPRPGDWIWTLIGGGLSHEKKKVSFPGKGLENVWKLERFHTLIPSFQTMSSMSIIMSYVFSDKQAWSADVE